MDCSPWGHKELDTTGRLSLSLSSASRNKEGDVARMIQPGTRV